MILAKTWRLVSVKKARLCHRNVPCRHLIEKKNPSFKLIWAKWTAADSSLFSSEVSSWESADCITYAGRSASALMVDLPCGAME